MSGPHPRSLLRRWIPRALLLAPLVVLVFVVRSWGYVSTYRLYLDRQVDDSHQSAAVQRFDVENQRVVPRIVTRGPDRLSFAMQVGRDSTIRADLRAAGRIGYEVRLRDDSGARTLAQGVFDRGGSIDGAFPGGNGVIELVTDGPATWTDPRVVRSVDLTPHSLVFLSALIAWLAWRRYAGPETEEEARATRIVLFGAVTVCGSLLMVLAASEALLRAAKDHMPAGIASERHDLGEVTRDERWEDTPRYGRRLRPDVDAVNEWNYGDIVRMGFIPPSVSPGTVHRFRFVTDREGFRNTAVRDHFQIAALGDSFTDAMTLSAGESWPAQLEQRLNVPVQNYGTAGFGPQQELLVLQDYVAAHRPKRVVLAFFAGNDIFDAEAYEQFRQSGREMRETPGWRIKDIVSRSDTWYVVSALKAGAAWLSRFEGPALANVAPPAPSPAPAKAAPAFDRGMFSVAVNDRVLEWAFMPPYLNTLRFSQEDFEARRGWRLTQDIIREMQRTVDSFGGQFIVMFLPDKSQVYWPLLEKRLSRAQRQSALRFYFGGDAPDLDAIGRNRLAQNAVVGAFCERAGIPFLDATSALQQRVESSGENVYFPDESHLNETGQAILAASLGNFLTRLP